MPWRCFMIRRDQRQNRYLRRLTHRQHKVCPASPEGQYGHDAWNPLDCVDDPLWHVSDGEERAQVAREADEKGNMSKLRKLVCGDIWPHNDDRWPEVCELCGEYVFQPSDEWQLHLKDLYRPVDDELLEEVGVFELPEAPPGAMWDAWWGQPKGPDDRALRVRLPDGSEWQIDTPATNGAPWRREGEPPDVTVSPSIDTGDYHGYLIEGVLTDDLEGRSYED